MYLPFPDLFIAEVGSVKYDIISHELNVYLKAAMDKQIIVYEPNEKTKMEVKTDGETV